MSPESLKQEVNNLFQRMPQGMKSEYSVYVAGKFEEKLRVKALQNTISNLGFHISYDWTPDTVENLSPQEACQYLQEASVRCQKGAFADYFVLINHPQLYGGNVELGIALGRAKRVIVLDYQVRANIFFYHPSVFLANSEEEVLEFLKEDFVQHFLTMPYLKELDTKRVKQEALKAQNLVLHFHPATSP